MDDAYRQYKEELKSLDTMLAGVRDAIEKIAKRMENKAWLAYPDPADVSDLNQIHERLTAEAGKIIDEMQELHRAFNEPAKNAP